MSPTVTPFQLAASRAAGLAPPSGGDPAGARTGTSAGQRTGARGALRLQGRSLTKPHCRRSSSSRMCLELLLLIPKIYFQEVTESAGYQDLPRLESTHQPQKLACFSPLTAQNSCQVQFLPSPIYRRTSRVEADKQLHHLITVDDC